ncbi:class I SAM-dependent DNA methyltransferase [Exiguobacterium artemiae]|uniref:class I SAM-dependent DNA methyltransferase n=1 Tax=Exiguobacterium artemiae TaxID=340145 RepID=UPI0004794052|nr:class I SAM-dependent methyltransferase [Exiguobacterium sibiricum]
MAYEQFAYVYDELMQDVPYPEWVAWVLEQVEPGKRIADIGCGTGTATLLLADHYEVTGVDLSEEMLEIAQEKAMETNRHVDFWVQDMRELELPDSVDAITILCDSLNYLQTESDVKQTFDSAARLLTDGGKLLFDVHSPYKMETLFNGKTYATHAEQSSYIWFADPGEDPLSVVHELTFFIEGEDGRYDRVDETHHQRTYPPEQYITWLREAGFRVCAVTGDFTSDAPTETAERIFFVAEKV